MKRSWLGFLEFNEDNIWTFARNDKETVSGAGISSFMQHLNTFKTPPSQIHIITNNLKRLINPLLLLIEQDKNFVMSADQDVGQKEIHLFVGGEEKKAMLISYRNQYNVLFRIKDIKLFSYIGYDEWVDVMKDSSPQAFLALVNELTDLGFDQTTFTSSVWNMFMETKRTKYRVYFPIIEDEEMITYIKESYRGGFCYVKPKRLNRESWGDISHWDINKSYSSVLKNGETPKGHPKFFKSKEEAVINGYPLIIYKVWVDKATIKKNRVPFIGMPRSLIDNLYEYPETFENKIIYLWDVEYNKFMETYDVKLFKSYKKLGFQSHKGHFDDFINYWAHMANSHAHKTTTLDAIRYKIAKTAPNVIIGKMGSRTNYINIKYEVSYGNKYKEEYEHRTSQPEYIALASYAASAARISLINAINQNWGRYLYCDTDSMYLIHFTEPKGIKVHDTELGAWKLSGQYNKIHIKGPKTLIKQNLEGGIEHTLAGVPRSEWPSIDFNTFK
jgi:hypothetical protein